MNIDYPAAGQISQLKALWKTAFGDEDVFLDKFFEIAYSPDRCRCITENEKIAAALYWFETFCGGQRFAYIYAVATDPEFRNRGLCRVLMENTKQLLNSQGYHGILLYPASDDLSRMYEKMGYERCTTVLEFQCEAAADPVPLRKIGKAEYAGLRRQLLPAGGVIQEGPMLDFLADQASFFAGDGWVAAVSMAGEEIHCHELLGKISAASGIVRALGQKRGFFRSFGKEKNFAMVNSLIENCTKPIYFGLPLD